ncbi:hypothetical protein AQ505_17590 [Pedobacter sp. PACM 27299]|uniref:DUF1016 N-terminal domain-containing protein n=1 Tax=Pedobacter sp. PACM 27299 TaxID=1727164 RepID=UPI0007061E2B|nr:DUF1016 N-terminal domain-containing protein [Pedobacter sp. PACM 27299]ALL07139.1 hypothetical protein AQ505_17590 [Pedobacter sp. PACM 27299]
MEAIEKQNILFEQITEVVSLARRKAYQQSNAILLQMYWQIGQLIIEDEQEGNAKAAYGKSVLKKLAQQLTLEFGKGFDERNLNNMRAFYNAFSIWNAVSTKLSWTHYRMISRLETNDLRAEYIRFAVEGGWPRAPDSEISGRCMWGGCWNQGRRKFQMLKNSSKTLISLSF